MNTNTSKRYRPRTTSIISAVQLELDTQGFTYELWGHKQTCRAGDWLVKSDCGDCYTIRNESFQRTYRKISPGRYRKHTTIRATQASKAGHIETQEGTTNYAAGDYLIENSKDGTDAYAITQRRFHELYELIEEAGEH